MDNNLKKMEQFFAWLKSEKGITKIDLMDAMDNYFDEFESKDKKSCDNTDPEDMCNDCNCWKHTRKMCG